MNGMDLFTRMQFEKKMKEDDLKLSRQKILESYNMIVKKLCLEEWDELKKIIDWAFEKERIEKEKKLTITSKELIDVIDYQELTYRM